MTNTMREQRFIAHFVLAVPVVLLVLAGLMALAEDATIRTASVPKQNRTSVKSMRQAVYDRSVELRSLQSMAQDIKTAKPKPRTVPPKGWFEEEAER